MKGMKFACRAWVEGFNKQLRSIGIISLCRYGAIIFSGVRNSPSRRNDDCKELIPRHWKSLRRHGHLQTQRYKFELFDSKRVVGALHTFHFPVVALATTIFSTLLLLSLKVRPFGKCFWPVGEVITRSISFKRDFVVVPWILGGSYQVMVALEICSYSNEFFQIGELLTPVAYSLQQHPRYIQWPNFRRCWQHRPRKDRTQI